MWSRGRQGIMIQACFSCSLLVLGTGSTHSTSWHENSGRVIIQRKMIFWTQKKGVGSWAGKTKWSPSTSGSILTLTSMEDSFLWVIFLSHWPPSSSRTLRTLYCLQPLTRAPFVSLECSQQGWLILFFFLTLYNPMDCSLPGSSVHGIFQARVLEWVVISFSGWLILIL